MAGAPTTDTETLRRRANRVQSQRGTEEPPLIKWVLIAVALVFSAVFLLLPLVNVFAQAFSKGLPAYWNSLTEPDSWSAIRLTLTVAAISVPLNVLFGVAAAWAIAKFEFRGKSLLTTLIDLPFSVSPVVAGLMFVLLFGLQGYFGKWLDAHEEQAALTLGANAWQTFWHVTLPSVKWGLIYGIILCNARAMGEFGAVSVVSGHITGQTDTMPLRVEKLYNDYHGAAAFAVASLLALLALLTLGIKTFLEWRQARAYELAQRAAEELS